MIFCPRCQKTEKPPNQARAAMRLLQWGQEAGITLHFSKDLGSELLYVCDGKWRHFDATVNKGGRIRVSWGLTENSIVYSKRQFMELVQRHRDYQSGQA